MNKLLLVIDVQNDFINNNTKNVVLKIEKELLNDENYDHIIFTRFINDSNSKWYNELHYTGCLSDHGKSIAIDTKEHLVFDKKIYSSMNKQLLEYISKNNINEIYLCGIDTECCVLKTALDLFENNYNIYVLKDYCACTHGIEKNNNALEIIGRCIGRKKLI